MQAYDEPANPMACWNVTIGYCKVLLSAQFVNCNYSNMSMIQNCQLILPDLRKPVMSKFAAVYNGMD